MENEINQQSILRINDIIVHCNMLRNEITSGNDLNSEQYKLLGLIKTLLDNIDAHK